MKCLYLDLQRQYHIFILFHMLQILKLLNIGHFFGNYDQLFGIMVKSMELCNIEKNPLNFGQTDNLGPYI